MATSKVMSSSTSDPNRTVDDVWRDIVSGRRPKAENADEMMTLEDFLVKAGEAPPPEVKIEPERLFSGDSDSGRLFGLALSPFQSGDWSGRKKLSVAEVAEPVMDRAAEQRQRRMIKNRESAARSRERKQAYQSELESLAVKLEEENETSLKEKAAHSKQRLKQLMERVVPVIEKRRPKRILKRTHSMEW